MRGSTPTATLWLAALLLAMPVGATDASVPWTVRLVVTYGNRGGPAAFLESLETRALAAAAAAACADRITLREDESVDAVWRVRVVDLEEETRYDDSVYGRHSSNRLPGSELQLTAEVRFDLESVVERTGEDGGRLKRLRIRETVRPLGAAGDPEEEARERALRRAGGDLARSFCRALEGMHRKARPPR